ncbi:amidase [Nisaea acidiphila]|uniref:Amidase n=1 Tax=Nisaea acidiphila TaxID=1862145 RepID=A0A9J7AVA8_9PROT|nr:amidase [Nisaea acidiphila]UUX49349.1 amidase [Nisaea acidiphila]
MAKLNELTASAAARVLAAGEASAEELMLSCLDRVAERDETVRAWAFLDPELALANARAADASRAAGYTLGPLHGVPVGIKDVIETADMPTENGSDLFRGQRTGRDADCVARLRNAGAVIMGKTVTTELANQTPSKTRNPHNPEHSPGGSSAGSGAAVGDFQVPLALGTQTGGSVIRPGSFNGIHAMKPSLGLIPREGVLMQSHTLDTVGVYGRSVEDLALIADSMAAFDATDAFSFGGRRSSLGADMALETPAPRFAFLETPAWPQADDGAQKAIEGVVDGLGAGCVRESLPSPFDRILDFHAAVMAAEMVPYYGGMIDASPEKASEMIKARLAEARKVAAGDYVEAVLARGPINDSLSLLLDRYDAVLCLPATGPAPHGFATTGSAIFNGLWTYLGVPCVTLPRLSVEGLPLGVQLVGKPGEDGKLLRVARWLDRELGG